MTRQSNYSVLSGWYDFMTKVTKLIEDESIIMCTYISFDHVFTQFKRVLKMSHLKQKKSVL